MDEEESNWGDVFDSVHNETRVEILHALADAYSETPSNPWVEYSDLRKTVGVRDNGNFNYHLDRLKDLVVKGEHGYRLSRTGMEVVSAVASGVFDTDWTWEPVDAPGACWACGDSLELRYDDGILQVTCGIEDHSLALSVAPNLLEAHPDDELVERIAFLENRWGALTRQGICSECQGHVTGQLEPADDPEQYHYHGECNRCGFQHVIPVGIYLVTHPAVVEFFRDHGVDVRTTPYWTLEFCSLGSETVESTNPLCVRVDVTQDDEVLSLTLDRAGDVVETERKEARTE